MRICTRQQEVLRKNRYVHVGRDNRSQCLYWLNMYSRDSTQDYIVLRQCNFVFIRQKLQGSEPLITSR